MKFLLSEFLTVANINIIEALRITVTGAVYIAAIMKCGIWAVMAIAMIRIIQIGAEI